jgi:hypothetical protein
MFIDHFKAMTLFGKGKYVAIELVRSKERSSNPEDPPYLLEKCDRGPKFIENSFTKSETSLT